MTSERSRPPADPAESLTEQAGQSALAEAVQLGLDIQGVQRQLSSLTELLRALRSRQGSFEAGAVGEQRVVRVLVDMVDTGWTVLPDRRWPGTRKANIDILLVGPGGVFVIDVKNWRRPRIEHGRLWRDQQPADDAVAKVLDQADAVRDVLVEVGLAPAEIVPLLVLTGRRTTRARLGTLQVVSESDLCMDLLRRGVRLTSHQVELVVAALDAACPPAATTVAAPEVVPRPRRAADDALTSGSTPTLEQVWAGLVEAAAAEPIEAWMTWLHPSQSRLVTRSWSGPARIRGAAGTGKTVVALHRARHLAEQGRRVVFCSYVRTLGPVFAGLFSRLAPELTGRVDFVSVHQIAIRLLYEAGLRVTIDRKGLDDCWHRAWATCHRDGLLDALAHPPRYWREEIDSVIKGRGVTDPATYATLQRVGRRTPLQPVHRQAVWRLYEEYERRRTERGLDDWADVLARALDAVHRGLIEPRWDAVIVDEVQDLTCRALRLLHALVGDRPDGLLMVGDGQQAVYPGGFTLAEAGISVAGRSVVLNRNYRNGSDILRQALEVLGDDTADNIDPDSDDLGGSVVPTRVGGRVVRAQATDPGAQQQALAAHLRDLLSHGARYGDIALLVASNAAARQWQRILERADVPTIALIAYDGRRVDAVKVGTFERGKGLDFAHVLVPDHDRTPGPRTPHESADAYAERARHERRRQYVAITRARDSLWLGTSGSEEAGRDPGRLVERVHDK